MQSFKDVLFEKVQGHDGQLGLITLNRPQALNALNHAMIQALSQQLITWAQDVTIKAVVIRAVEGRAFCAGGDIRAIYEMKVRNNSVIGTYFADEYHLNQLIFHFPKPFIALLDGITMGGGAGISIHGSHRVATDQLLFAMPETGIGFHPDIGSSYFLSRLPHKWGLYLGLTGDRIHHSDCLALNLVDFTITRENRDPLIQALVDTSLPDRNAVSQVLSLFHVKPLASTLLTHTNDVEKYFSANCVEDIIAGLEKSADPWCKDVANHLKTRSPTSLKVTFHEITTAAQCNFDECIQSEYRSTMRFVLGADFYEGIRAAIIDKDHNPRWQPMTLSQVQDISTYFKDIG